MSKEYVERDAAAKAAKDGADEWDGGYSRYRDAYIKCAINRIPAADVVEVRHGRWTDHRTIEHDGEWYCTACGEEVTICSCGKDKTWKYPYCPNCGAKMTEDHHEQKE